MFPSRLIPGINDILFGLAKLGSNGISKDPNVQSCVDGGKLNGCKHTSNRVLQTKEQFG